MVWYKGTEGRDGRMSVSDPDRSHVLQRDRSARMSSAVQNKCFERANDLPNREVDSTS